MSADNPLSRFLRYLGLSPRHVAIGAAAGAASFAVLVLVIVVIALSL